MEQPRLTRRQNAWQALKFLLFSISAGGVQAAAFTLMRETLRLPYWPCYLVALILSVVYNFTLNRAFTFQSAANVPAAMLKILGYYAVFTPLSTWWGDALTRAGWNDYLVLFLTMLTNLVTEFLFCRLVVYRNSINTNSRGQRDAARYAQQQPRPPAQE